MGDGDQRLLGAVLASESYENVLREAMRSMVEARFLLGDIGSNFSLLERRDHAVRVLEAGILDTREALGLSDA